LLRTGGSTGCDESARQGYIKAGFEDKIELYLPWQGFNGHYGGILHSQTNWKTASEHVKHWDTLKLNHKIFHARNAAIITGSDGVNDCNLTVCWTENGETVGSSATSILISLARKIPVFNLSSKTGLTKLRKFCKKL
jgi:hypothetical protein